MSEFVLVRHYLGLAEDYAAKLEDQRDANVRTINDLTEQLDVAVNMLAHNVYGSEERARAAIRRALEKAGAHD